MASLADLAVDDGLDLVELFEPLAKLIERDVDGAGQRTADELLGRAYVDELGTSDAVVVDLAPLHRLDEPRKEILSDVAKHVDGVLRRAEGWRVREFEVRELRSREPGSNRGREHVDAFVDTLGAHALGTENRSRSRINEQFERHRRRPGVVRRV